MMAMVLIGRFHGGSGTGRLDLVAMVRKWQ